MSLPWLPYYDLQDCDHNSECVASGYLKDYVDALAAELNFTYSNHLREDGAWGVAPVGKPPYHAGSWIGAVRGCF